MAGDRDRHLWAAVGRDRLRDISPDAQIRVDRIVVHQGYDPRRASDEIALVRLAEIAGADVDPPLRGTRPARP